jgi:hypothetical protein
MRVKRSPGLRHSITSSNGWLRKVYRYEAEQDAGVLAERMDLASRCSRLVGSVPEMSWRSTAEVVEVRQQRVRRLPVEPGPECAEGLLALARDLDAMAGWGMVHGDLNRKNILWTEEGYRLVDFEPVLCVRRTDGRTLLRGTAPYVHPEDLKRNAISRLSDRLGFACFAGWVRGRFEKPREAATQLSESARALSFVDLSR